MQRGAPPSVRTPRAGLWQTVQSSPAAGGVAQGKWNGALPAASRSRIETIAAGFAAALLIGPVQNSARLSIVQPR